MRVCNVRPDPAPLDLSVSGLAQAADAALRALQGGAGLYNADTGWRLRINKKSRKKMGDNAGQTPPASKAIAALGELALQAVVVERHADARHANPDVAAVLRLYAPMSIRGQAYRVKLTVLEYRAEDAVLHALDAVEIEGAPPGIFPSYSGDVLQTGQPTTGRTLSIVDLLRGATDQAGRALLVD